jgi:hypothetical protein
MLKKLCETKLEFKEVPALTLMVIPLAFVSSILGGTGHAPTLFYIPYALVFGPLAVLGFFVGERLGGWGILFAIAGPYPLYLVYGYIFAYSARSSHLCQLFIVTVLLLHLLSGLVFLYLGGAIRLLILS